MTAEHGSFVDVHVADFACPVVDIPENVFVEAPQIPEIHDARRRIFSQREDAQGGDVALRFLQQISVRDVQFIFQDKRIRIAIDAVLFEFIIIIFHFGLMFRIPRDHLLNGQGDGLFSGSASQQNVVLRLAESHVFHGHGGCDLPC